MPVRVRRRPPRRRARPCVRDPRGQASVDYVAILVVAGLVLLAGAALSAARGPGIAASVRSEFLRALCIVTAGDCERDRAPCVVRSDGTSVGAHVNLAFFRVGREHLALLEERSDGTFAVTLLRTTDFGFEVGVGVDGHLALGSRLVAAGAELRAALVAHEGRGRTWVAGSRDEVSAVLEGLLGAVVPKAVQDRVEREPDETVYEHGYAVTLSAGAGAGAASGAVTLGAKDLDGARAIRATGHHVLYLSRANELTAALSSGSRGAASGSVAVGSDHVWGVEVDASGRPLDLVIVTAGELRGARSVPGPARRVVEALRVPPREGRRYEIEQHLDLTDPENLAAASAFIAAVREGGPRPGRSRAPVSAALAARLRAEGIVHVRTYEADEATTGGGGHVALGVKVGGAAARTERSGRLLAAATRGRDGTWGRRDDCTGST